jgi:FAD/FMN-containing dehydrogenase
MAPPLSWGRYPRLPQRIAALSWRDDPLPPAGPWLPRGLGRSYGDSCLAPAGGLLLGARGLDRFMAFDAATGVLRCEAGVTLAEILDFAVPRGWILPALPGTRQVTVGGAIANDVHGKNHHVRGSFGHALRRFLLRRSDGSELLCSAAENPGWFAATIGGLGLTGLIVWAELQLMACPSPVLEVECTRFHGLDGFFDLAAASEGSHEYTVAWVDCLARGRELGRGLFLRANPAPPGGPVPPPPRRGPAIPLTPPLSPVNRLTLAAFNWAYYRRPRPQRMQSHYVPYFFPLDAIGHWNRLYGARGFLQYQCLTPADAGREPIREILERISAAGLGSFLAVLKTFGAPTGLGPLSFARPGTTLALDFPYTGPRLLALLDSLDRVVMACGGAVYPAKDARMGADAFQAFFPRWREVEALRDPAICSAFWQRVTGARPAPSAVQG